MASFSESSEIQIRAPAFARLVKTIVGFTSREIFDDFPEDDEDDTVISLIRTRYINENGASTSFPTDDMDLLAKMILKVIRVYSRKPKISGKINMCTAIMMFGSLHIDMARADFENKNKRAKEINDMNNAFYLISSEISSGKNVSVSAKLNQVENPDFHPDSQYVVFRVEM